VPVSDLRGSIRRAFQNTRLRNSLGRPCQSPLRSAFTWQSLARHCQGLCKP
jgi:hypothetical protein